MNTELNILASYKGGPWEAIDGISVSDFDSREAAEEAFYELLGEYHMAYGPGWEFKLEEINF